jgi:hypothetical protein
MKLPKIAYDQLNCSSYFKCKLHLNYTEDKTVKMYSTGILIFEMYYTRLFSQVILFIPKFTFLTLYIAYY